MIEREIRIGHRMGLHARAAARLVELSKQFESRIVLVRNDRDEPRTADARSILGILLLAASQGTPLLIQAHGADEAAAIDSISRYLSE